MKLKKWIKEHEVTVMMIGSAIAGAGVLFLGQKTVGYFGRKTDDRIRFACSVTKDKVFHLSFMPYSNPKKGIDGYCSLNDGLELAKGIVETIASATKTNVLISSQKKPVL